MDDALDEFLTRCEAVNLSPNTIAWYRDMVNRFIRSVGEYEVEMVTPAHARRFLAEKRKGGCHAPTCNAYLRALNAFFNWLVKEEILPASPLARVEYMKEPGGTKAALGQEHLKQLIGGFDRRTFTGLRNYTLCRTFAETGGRAR